jgi:hypothetical protein
MVRAQGTHFSFRIITFFNRVEIRPYKILRAYGSEKKLYDKIIFKCRYNLSGLHIMTGMKQLL